MLLVVNCDDGEWVRTEEWKGNEQGRKNAESVESLLCLLVEPIYIYRRGYGQVERLALVELREMKRRWRIRTSPIPNCKFVMHIGYRTIDIIGGDQQIGKRHPFMVCGHFFAETWTHAGKELLVSSIMTG